MEGDAICLKPLWGETLLGETMCCTLATIQGKILMGGDVIGRDIHVERHCGGDIMGQEVAG